MNRDEQNILQKLLVTFKEEAQDHLTNITSGLIELEKQSLTFEQQLNVLEAIYREIHTLKGASRAVNLLELEAVCQSLETIFFTFKQRKSIPTLEQFDLLHSTFNLIEKLVSSNEMMQDDIKKQLQKLLSPVNALQSQISSKTIEDKEKNSPPPLQKQDIILPVTESPPIVEEKSAIPKSVRITTEKLDNVLLKAEEMLSAKLSIQQRASEVKDILSLLKIEKRNWSKIESTLRKKYKSLNTKIENENLDNQTQKIISEFSNFLKSLDEKLSLLLTNTQRDRRALASTIDSLLDDTKQLVMLPFSIILTSFGTMVRDISRERGKLVNFALQGENIEIDKRILEELKDPLVHIVRNAIDHGIESPEQRKLLNKPEQGIISIAIAQVLGNQIEIKITDDGCGIESEKVIASAINQGYLSQEDAKQLTEKEIISLIYQSGISTSPILTEFSGRGLGMAIVREKVEKLGGNITLETKHQQGTTIRIVLPLTVATFKGILLRTGNQHFILATGNVERALRIEMNAIKTVENKETVTIEDMPLPLIRLNDILDIPNSATSQSTFVEAVILNTLDDRIVLQIDEVLYEQEVLVKKLGTPLVRVRNIAGATILGSGKVVPILNAFDIAKSVKKNIAKKTAVAEAKTNGKDKPILVVEDSITTRLLLKNILEMDGYQVNTAIDGLEGFEMLRKSQYALVVSDIEMPRMDGYELTSKIRADKNLANLPVVLVTALANPEDRERGIDVGANAYIIKSSFDNSNLLEIVKKLL